MNNAEFFTKQLEEKKVLIASHRGVVGGNIIENTIGSFNNALLHGADIVETDVVNSVDGELFCYHDGYEPFHFLTAKHIYHMTAEEIRALRFTNRYFMKIDQGVQPFEEALEFLKSKNCLINLDRRYRDFDKTLKTVRKFGMEKQVIFKTFVEGDLLKRVADDFPDIMFMPLMGKAKEIGELEKYDLNIIGCELVFAHTDDDIVSTDSINYLMGKYGMLWANPITCDDELIISGGKNDDISLKEGFDAGWGWLIDRGFNVLQTDWPALVLNYLRERGIRK